MTKQAIKQSVALAIWIALKSMICSNTEFNRTAYHPNATLVKVFLYWHATIPCNFDFSNFPLDDQSCVTKLGIWDVNVTQFDPS